MGQTLRSGVEHGEYTVAVRDSPEPRDAKALLAKNDSYAFFSEPGDLVITGATRTNGNDYRAILIT